MKKIMSTCLIALTLSLTAPKPQAEASVIVGGFFGLGASISCGAEWYEVAAIAGGTVAGITAGILIIRSGLPGLGTTFIVLDEKGNYDQNQLAAHFSHKYSFVNNEQVIFKLAQAVNEKYEELKKGDEVVYVTLQSSQVEQILRPLDLSTEQMNLVMTDLTK